MATSFPWAARVGAALLLVLGVHEVSAQQLAPAGYTTRRATPEVPAAAARPPAETSDGRAQALSPPVTTLPTGRRATWWAPAASLLVPGAGQLLLGQQRSAAYAVAEVFLIAQSLAAQRDVTNGIREYQRIAADVARKSGGRSLPKGPWTYYEALEKYDASGAFDVTPGGAVDPETDERTFNGEMWLLARTTYWNNARVMPAVTSMEYQRAIAFYMRRAVRDEFAWSWFDANSQKGIYRQTVSETNRSNQRKTNLLTVVGANHVASLIDAYISVRIRRYGGAGMVGMRLDGIETRVSAVGDPAGGQRAISTHFRLVPAGSAHR